LDLKEIIEYMDVSNTVQTQMFNKTKDQKLEQHKGEVKHHVFRES